MACSGLSWGSTSLIPEEDAYQMIAVGVQMLWDLQTSAAPGRQRRGVSPALEW